jgi:hypothetical protein
MNIKELKKLINEEVNKMRLVKEVTNPGTPRAKIKAAQPPPIDPNSNTYVTAMPKDPSVPPPESKQPKSNYEITNPTDFYKGILRLHNALRDKFDLEINNQEVYELIRDITSEEVEKIRSKYPEMGIADIQG